MSSHHYRHNKPWDKMKYHNIYDILRHGAEKITAAGPRKFEVYRMHGGKPYLSLSKN